MEIMYVNWYSLLLGGIRTDALTYLSPRDPYISPYDTSARYLHSPKMIT
jgi:hypothetical protein